MLCSLPAQSCEVDHSPHKPRVEGVLKYSRSSIIALVLQMQHKEIKHLQPASTGGVRIRTQKDRFLTLTHLHWNKIKLYLTYLSFGDLIDIK